MLGLQVASPQPGQQPSFIEVSSFARGWCTTCSPMCALVMSCTQHPPERFFQACPHPEQAVQKAVGGCWYAFRIITRLDLVGQLNNAGLWLIPHFKSNGKRAGPCLFPEFRFLGRADHEPCPKAGDQSCEASGLCLRPYAAGGFRASDSICHLLAFCPAPLGHPT